LKVFQNGTFWIITKSSKKEYSRIFILRQFWILRTLPECSVFKISISQMTAHRF